MTYKIQIDDEVRDATADEIKAIETTLSKKVAQDKTISENATARTALLAKLGITADEAALLLG